MEGRKHSLMDLRKKMLDKHEQYMRKRTDETYAALSETELVNTLKSYKEYCGNTMTKEDMQEKLKMIEHTRHLKMWHDQSPVWRQHMLAVHSQFHCI